MNKIPRIKTRTSNLEILRIISIILLVIIMNVIMILLELLSSKISIFSNLIYYFNNINSPLVLILTVLIFTLFRKLNVKNSEMINKIASTTWCYKCFLVCNDSRFYSRKNNYK